MEVILKELLKILIILKNWAQQQFGQLHFVRTMTNVTSYHTYGQSDVYKIDPRFGTNEDYLRLSSELHKRDMKNHHGLCNQPLGLEHWMVKDLPTYDWIHQFPGYYPIPITE
jgi:hypothetical protein